MQADLLETLWSWALATLLYPGLLFGMLLALSGERLTGAVRPHLLPRPQRTYARPRLFLQPVYDMWKLAGRQRPTALPRQDAVVTPPGRLGSLLRALCVIAPVLVLALLPLPGSPILHNSLLQTDLFTVVVLLSIQPLVQIVPRLHAGGLTALSGARDLGRLCAGAVPLLVALAALVEVLRPGSLRMASLLVAPETAAQTLVRLLAGAALLPVLPWWLDRQDATHDLPESAGSYAGRLLQTAALATFWSVVVLPMPGDLPWALIVTLAGALAAYVTIRTLSERWAPARRERDAANLLWATALPGAALAFLLAIWAS